MSTTAGGEAKPATHTIPPPKTSGAATGGQQLSASANQFVDKIDPFSKRGNSRRRRRLVGSSRYHTDNEPDLVQLPLIKGFFLLNFKLLYFLIYRRFTRRTNKFGSSKASAMSKDF